MFVNDFAQSVLSATRKLRTKTKAQAALIGRIRAALEKDTRVNLHHFPIAT